MDNERFEPVVAPTPPEGLPVVAQEPTQVHIVEATQPPLFTGVPTAPAIAVGYSDAVRYSDAVGYTDPTAVVPVQAVAVQAVQPPPYTPLPPLQAEERFIADERRPAWPYIVAALALLAGGLTGFLIGSAGDDEKPAAVTAPAGDVVSTFNMLLDRTRADGEYMSPSEYPQLDEITAIDNAAATRDLQAQVEVLTAAQEQAKALTDQVTALETTVAALTAERDALAAQVAGNGGTNTDMQAQLDAANAEIGTLTADLAAVRTELDTAKAALTTAQADLAAAQAVLDALNLMPAPNYVNADIARVRTEAAANGWTLVEQPTNSTTVAAGTVLEQIPAANTNMVEGSVLYVKVAKRP